MPVFDRQIVSVTNLISKYGQTVTWSKIPKVVSDVNKPWEATNGTKVDYSVKMVFTTKYKYQNYMKYIENSIIPEGDSVGLMAVQNFTPELNDIVTRSGIPLIIESINQISPNGELLLYIIVFKR